MMSTHEAVDFFRIEDMLSDDERMVRDTVRRFVRTEVLPSIDTHFEAATFPSQIIPILGEMGVLGMQLDGYGCAGMNPVQYGLVCQELEYGDSGVRSFMSVQSSLCMYPIWLFGSESQKQTLLPQMAQGKLVGCFGLTEPDAGSDPASMKTTAQRTANGWVLRGTKMWITNGSIADIAVVWAKTNDGIRGFVVEKDRKGFSAPEMRHKMSLRASVTSELVLDDVAVPEENLLPGTRGLSSPLRCLNSARYGIAWGAVGAAKACYEEALSYVQERKQFGRPLAAFQLVQDKLAWMLTEITKNQLLVYQLGRLMTQKKHSHVMISMAKMTAVKTALEISRVARDMLGANGISLEYCPIRHACNLESVNTYEGAHDIHRLILGEAITGISAFSG